MYTIILSETRSAFYYAKSPENFGWKSNGKVCFDSSGPSLDRFDLLNQSDENLPFHFI